MKIYNLNLYMKKLLIEKNINRGSKKVPSNKNPLYQYYNKKFLRLQVSFKCNFMPRYYHYFHFSKENNNQPIRLLFRQRNWSFYSYKNNGKDLAGYKLDMELYFLRFRFFLRKQIFTQFVV